MAYCPWDGQHAARVRGEGRIVAGRSRDSQDAARMRHGRAIAQDMGRAGRAGNQTCRAVPLMVPWDGQDDATCWRNMGDWHTFTSTKKCGTQCGRRVHMVRGLVPWECLQMRKLDREIAWAWEAMGGPWARMGNVYRKANWTANVQAGMCTRVARGVSVTLFLLNCAIRQAGQRRVHGARSSVRLCVRLCGHENLLDGTDGGRARVGRSTACASVVCVRLHGHGNSWDGTDGVAHAWDGRLLVVCARSTATACLRSAFDCDCTSACARLRPHVCVRSTATARLRALDCDCLSALCIRLRLHVVRV